MKCIQHLPFNALKINLVVCATLITMGYLFTLMTDVSGCAAEYCVDIGEFQIALAEGGTVHATGYPLYLLLGTPFVSGLRYLGISPAAAGSLYSFFWELLALFGILLILARLTQQPWLAGSMTLALAFTKPIWIHGVVAEVYSLSLWLTVIIIWLTLDLHDKWNDHKGLCLAFVAGLGVAHHRLIGLMLPAVGLYLLPSAWRSKNFWRWLALTVPCFLFGFLPYLDMPFRVWRGATWVYGTPTTWKGFWHIFLGTEASYLQSPILSIAELKLAILRVLNVFRAEIGGSGLLLAVIGTSLALGRRSTRPVALFLLGINVSYLLFSIIFHNAVLIEAVLILPLVCTGACMVIGFGQLPRPWQLALSAILFTWAGYLSWRHYPAVQQLTQDSSGRSYITQVEKLEAPPGAIVMTLWGQKYFNLAYAQRIEKRMSQWRIVDHRADFAQLAQATDGKIYTSADTLYLFPIEAWQQILGEPLRITSAGVDMIALTAQPLPSPDHYYPISAAIGLVDWDVRLPDAEGKANIVLYWTATQTPTINYSTYVHVTDKGAIQVAEDLLAQSDFATPIYGWYPTTQWLPNEIIREDHPLVLSDDKKIHTIIVGMYQRTADGAFNHLQPVILTEYGGQWRIEQ